MSIKAISTSLYVCFLLFLTSCVEKPKDVILRANTGFALGTTYAIQYEITDEKEDYKDEIENVFYEVNQSISTYIPTSDISKINKGTYQPKFQHLVRGLQYARKQN